MTIEYITKQKNRIKTRKYGVFYADLNDHETARDEIHSHLSMTSFVCFFWFVNNFLYWKTH